MKCKKGTITEEEKKNNKRSLAFSSRKPTKGKTGVPFPGGRLLRQ
jgi:hypothetical protein